MTKKLSYDYVFNCFKEKDCMLLEVEYVNNHTNMQYICECGNEDKITWNAFQYGQRCSICKSRKISEIKKYSFDYIKKYFEEKECVLLENEYINSHIPMKYICECGNKAEINFNNFQQGKRCWICRNNKIANKKRLTYEYVYNYFENNNCSLLENNYIDSHILMKYICECGNFSFISFNNFQQGKRCSICGIKKNSGENHYLWNPNLTDEDRADKRNLKENIYWRKQVFEKDNYTCQICGQRGIELEAHHLNGYHWCIKERFDIDNGVSLCLNCHSHKIIGSFHSVYGTSNNTKEQFKEYKLLKQNELKNSKLQEAI